MARDARLRRRTVGGDRDGDRRKRRGRDHGVERPRRAAPAAHARRQHRRERARTWTRCSCGRAVSRSSACCCSPISIITSPARRSLRRSACCRSRRLRSSARHSSADCSGGGDRARRDRGPRRSASRVWAYTLLLPSFVAAGLIDRTILDAGLFGIHELRPQALFGVDAAPLTHGVLWSLGLNILAFVTVSLLTSATPIERLQANVFVESEQRTDRAELPAVALVGHRGRADRDRRALSRRGTDAKIVREFLDDAAACRSIPGAKRTCISFATPNIVLASAIGAASSRLVLSLLLRKGAVSPQAALKLLDDASAAIQYNREILQSAHRSRAGRHCRVRQGPAAHLLE